MKDRGGKEDAIEMHRNRALPPGGLQRVPMVMAKAYRPATGWVPATARVHGGCRVWLKGGKKTLEKAEHFCVDTHKHISISSFFFKLCTIIRHVLL